MIQTIIGIWAAVIGSVVTFSVLASLPMLFPMGMLEEEKKAGSKFFNMLEMAVKHLDKFTRLFVHTTCIIMGALLGLIIHNINNPHLAISNDAVRDIFGAMFAMYMWTFVVSVVFNAFIMAEDK